MFDMNELMKKAQEMQQTMQAQQSKLAQESYEVSVGGEMVKMKFNGKLEAQAITIDPEIVDPHDLETLQDLILSAVNEGIQQGQEKAQNTMMKQFGGLGNLVANLNLSGFPPK